MMVRGSCSSLLLQTTLLLLLYRRAADAQTTGEQFCEGHGWDRATCLQESDCCEWNKRDGECFSAVGDALCGTPSTTGGFGVGDEVFIGEAANDEHACITAVNADGSYQVDYRDGFTSDERVDASDAHALVSAETRDCRNEPPIGVDPPPFVQPEDAIYDVESSADLTGAPIDCAGLTADGNYDNACQIPSALLPATIVYNLNGRRELRQIALLSDWWAKRPDQGTIEICVDTWHDDETGGFDVGRPNADGPGCSEWQLVSNFAFPATNSQNVCGVDGCSACSYQPGDGSYAAGGVSHMPISFAPFIQDVTKVRVTLDAQDGDGNDDVILKEFVVADTMRYDCEAIDCKGCQPFDPSCNPLGVDAEVEECPMPHVQTSRDVNGMPIPCIGVTADSLHQASCTVQDDVLPATVVYDLGQQQDIEQIVMLSDWWAKRPDGGSVEVCFESEWIPGAGCSAHADPLDQCFADCAETGKGIYADPLAVGDQTPACATGCAFYFDYAKENPATRANAKQTCLDWCRQADQPDDGYGQGGCSFLIPGSDDTLNMCAACAEPGWPTGCPHPGDCEAGCNIADGIVPCADAELPGDGCTAWLRVANFAFENNNHQVCEVDGCGRCCYQRGDNCEAPEAGISHLPIIFTPPLQDVARVRLTFDSVAADHNEQVIFREIHFLQTAQYACGALQCCGYGPGLVNPDSCQSLTDAPAPLQCGGNTEVEPLPGCMDPAAVNYNPAANRDDHSCRVPGCTNTMATNYSPRANEDDGSCVIVLPCADALSDLAPAIQRTCCPAGSSCANAAPTSCSARCAELWTPFSLVCSSLLQDEWQAFNTLCETRYYRQQGGRRCDLNAEWSAVSAACDCGRNGCDGFATPVECTVGCMDSFQNFMSRCHERLDAQHPQESASLGEFLHTCQEQTGYVMQSQEPGGGGGGH